jgi:hypothetical protein
LEYLLSLLGGVLLVVGFFASLGQVQDLSLREYGVECGVERDVDGRGPSSVSISRFLFPVLL